MTDDNIIGIDGREAVLLRKDQAEREAREQILGQKLKCEGLELRPGNAPGSYTIAHPNPPQPAYLSGGRDLSLDQVEDATSGIDVGQDPRFGCDTLRAVRFGKPWRLGLPACYVERLDALEHYYYAQDMGLFSGEQHKSVLYRFAAPASGVGCGGSWSIPCTC